MSETLSMEPRIDELARIVVGELRSAPFQYPQLAEQKLHELRTSPGVFANVRHGKGNQWFATIEDGHALVVLISPALDNQQLAKITAVAAFEAIRASR